MSSPFRPIDRKGLLAAIAFQSDLLALATTLETAQGNGGPSDFSAVATELHHLEQMARETADPVRSDSLSAPQ